MKLPIIKCIYTGFERLIEAPRKHKNTSCLVSSYLLLAILNDANRDPRGTKVMESFTILQEISSADERPTQEQPYEE